MDQKFCCDCGEPIDKLAKLRCRECYNEARERGETVCSHNPNTAPYERNPLFAEMDNAFRLAMLSAVDAGLERPPGMKISTAPCTRRPVFVEPPRVVSIRSASALLIEAAGIE